VEGGRERLWVKEIVLEGSNSLRGKLICSAIPGEPVIPPAPTTPTKSASTDSKPAQPTPQIDPSLPQTTIQLRLADGTRLVTQFNLSSTMEDVYSFVSQARPTQGREFVLQTIFPTRVLERGNNTVEKEGLNGGTIVMRWNA
jgi:UBX domain-containing protein 1